MNADKTFLLIGVNLRSSAANAFTARRRYGSLSSEDKYRTTTRYVAGAPLDVSVRLSGKVRGIRPGSGPSRLEVFCTSGRGTFARRLNPGVCGNPPRPGSASAAC